MKKIIAALMTVLFLGNTGLALADTGGGAGKVSIEKSHKKGGKRKHKSTLNPQPLPPRQLPLDAGKNGAKTAN
jgi:hypothetical protein